MKASILFLMVLTFFMSGCSGLQQNNQDFAGYDHIFQLIREARFEDALAETNKLAHSYELTSNMDELIRKRIEQVLVLNRLGLFKEGETVLKKMLTGIQNPSPLQMANLHHALAESQLNTMQFDASVKSAQLALDFFNKNRLWDHILDSTLVLHHASFRKGDTEEAERQLNVAFEVAERLMIPAEWMRVNNVAGIYYHAMGNLSKGYECLNRAIEEAALADNTVSGYILSMRRFLMMVLDNDIEIRTLESLSGDLSKSWVTLTQAQKDELKLWPPDIARIRLFLRQKFHKKALDMLLTLQSQIAHPDENFLCLAAEVQMANGNFREAGHLLWPVMADYEMRWIIQDDDRQYIFPQWSLTNPLDPYHRFLESLAHCVEKGETQDSFYLPVSDSLPLIFLTVSEYVKGRNLVESIRTREGRFLQKLSSPWKEKEDTLVAKSRQFFYRQKVIDQFNPEAVERMSEQKKDLQKSWFEFIHDARKEKLAWVNWRYPQMGGALPFVPDSGQVIVDYVVTPRCVISIVLDETRKPILHVHNVSVEDLKRELSLYIDPFERNAETGRIHIQEFSLQRSHSLYISLFAPIASSIRFRENLVIIPDDFLAYLPFETLAVSKGNSIGEVKMICDDFNVSYATSLTVLELLNSLTEKSWMKEFFGVANPIFDNRDPRVSGSQGLKKVNVKGDYEKYAFRGQLTRHDWKTKGVGIIGNERIRQRVVFPVLPETELEVKTASRLLGQADIPPDILVSEDATEENVSLTDLSRYRIIHFATHAEVNGRLVGLNEPFILLGQVGNTQGYDGFLTRSEVAGMTIDSELAVLSACMTAKGQLVSGEGLVNFVHAFHSAGTRNVLVTLWEVASEPTVEFMTSFYRSISAGYTASEALRHAKIGLRQRYANPYYWAPFVLYGVGDCTAQSASRANRIP